MTKNMFYYTRKSDAPVKEGEKAVEYRDSFNINKCIRSVTHTDGTIIVILDDFNERVTEKQYIEPKSGKFKGYKKVRETIQSEIILSATDGERFYKLTNIEL